MGCTFGVLKGDGIGPEVVSATKRVIEEGTKRTGFEPELIDLPFGQRAYERHGTAVPTETFEKLKQFDGCICGPIVAEIPEDDPLYPKNPSGFLREAFHLYANIRPATGYATISRPNYRSVDWVVFRQNTEGFYADRNMEEGIGEFKPTRDVGLSVRVISHKECRRIAEAAFQYAEENGYDSVVAGHEINGLKLTDGIFLDECESVAEEFPSIRYEDQLMDSLAADVVHNPEQYDVIVTTNMFGDIISDLTSALVGGLGLGPGLNVGEAFAMAQPTHGCAPDIAGEGMANPIGMIRSTKMLIRWYGEEHDDSDAVRMANAIEEAVERTIESGESLTPDVGGGASTDEYVAAVVANMGL